MDFEAENEHLRSVLSELEHELEGLRAQRAELLARAEAAEQAARKLQRDLELLRRKIVGPSSERFVDPSQLPLPMSPNEVPATGGSPDTPDPPGGEDDGASGEAAPERRKKRKKNRRKVEEMDHLPTEVHHDEHQPTCPCGCGARGVVIGQDVSWRLERTPAKIVRHKNIRDRFAFPEHRGFLSVTSGDVEGGIWTAPPPIAYALPGALCGNELLVQVAIDKYCDHLPLYRQFQRFLREGLDLSRSTLCDWMMEFGELLTPIVNHLGREVLGGEWLRADATGMPVIDRSRTKGRAHRGHLWAWGNYDTVVFSYTPDKSAVTVAALFPDFQGVVLLDGATDFNLLEKADGVTRAGCWAHARRKFYDALAYDSVLAMRGLAAIRQLFLAERVVMAAQFDERVALRDELCRPILNGLKAWVDAELPRAVPRSPIHSALGYVDRQWERLCVFLEHAAIGCHNNWSERALRKVALLRNNSLYAGGRDGAIRLCTLFTLINTCRLIDVDPYAYLVWAMTRVVPHSTNRGLAPVDLTPAAYKAAQEQAA